MKRDARRGSQNAKDRSCPIKRKRWIVSTFENVPYLSKIALWKKELRTIHAGHSCLVEGIGKGGLDGAEISRGFDVEALYGLIWG